MFGESRLKQSLAQVTYMVWSMHGSLIVQFVAERGLKSDLKSDPLTLSLLISYSG